MTDAQLYQELSALPDSLKQEVADFITFLKQKVQPKEPKERPLGLAKDKIFIKDNFDDPIPNVAGDLEKQFNELATKWKDETRLYSLPPKKINETYLKIIARGESYLPFILKDIQRGGSVYWHFALKAITGNNEIQDDFSRSRILKDAWIKWGKDNFII